MSTPAQNSLRNFYMSVQYHNPRLAAVIADDVYTVAINSLGADKSGGTQAAMRLREKAVHLPPVMTRVLDNALTELGYS